MTITDGIALAALIFAVVGPFIGAYVGSRVGMAVLKQRVDVIEDRIGELGRRSHQHAHIVMAHRWRLRTVEAKVGVISPEDD